MCVWGVGGWRLGGLFVLMQLFNKKFNAAVTMTHLKVINSTLVSSTVQLLSAGDPQTNKVVTNVSAVKISFTVSALLFKFKTRQCSLIFSGLIPGVPLRKKQKSHKL